MLSRADVLLRYGLPDTPAFEMEVQQHARQTVRVRVKHEAGAVSMSTGHLSSLAHEIGPVDFLLARQIQNLLKEGRILNKQGITAS